MNTAIHRAAIAGIAVIALAAIDSLVLDASSASATGGGLEFLSSFNGSDNPGFPGGFAAPNGVTVDQSNHHVYVADTGDSTVDVFNSAGIFQSELGEQEGLEGLSVAVDDATGEAYVATNRVSPGGSLVVYVYNAAGVRTATWTGSETPSGNFGNGYLQVAVDNSTQPSSGDVYAASTANDAVDRLSASGSPAEFTGTVCGGCYQYISGSQLIGTPEGPFGQPEPRAVAVDRANGDLFVDAGNAVDVYNAKGEYLFHLKGAALSYDYQLGIAVDGSTGTIYVGDPGSDVLDVFDAAGNFQYEVLGTPSGGFAPGEGGGVGVDEENGDVYMSDRGGRVVDVFQSGPLPAMPNTEAVSDVTATTATLNGMVNPEGVSTSYYFSYATGASCLGADTATASAGSGTVGVHEEETVTGLEPSTEYSFCFYTQAGQTVRASPPVTFKTAGEPPTIDAQPITASGITASETLLHGTINSNKQDTTYYFRYGTTTAYGSTSTPPPGTDIGSSLTDQAVADELTGLMPGTTYHYQLVAINASGETQSSPDETFTTLVPPPSAVTGVASEVIYDAATVSGVVNPNGPQAAADTRWCFEYGTIAGGGYGLGSQPLVAGDAGTGGASVSVSVRLTGLAPGESYRYRVVAVNAAGLVEGGSQACGVADSQETDGTEGTFTTPITPVPPSVATGAASGVTQNSAILSGTVDPDGTATSYAFQIGVDTSYGVQLFAEAGTGSEPQSVSVNVGELQPGTTYHYRLIAKSLGGAVYGADETFTTPVFPAAALTAPLTEPLVAIPGFAFPTIPANAAIQNQKTAKARKKSRRHTKPKGHRKQRSAGGKKASSIGPRHAGHERSR